MPGARWLLRTKQSAGQTQSLSAWSLGLARKPGIRHLLTVSAGMVSARKEGDGSCAGKRGTTRNLGLRKACPEEVLK